MKTSRHVKGLLPAFFLLAGAFLISPAVSLRIEPNQYEGGRSRDELARAERNSSAVAQVFGELRTSLSDVMFIKTERYLHSGVAYEAHLTDELLSIGGETAEYAEHQSEVGMEPHDPEENAGTPSIIPTAADDFRGFIGDLQREVKPWRDPGLGHEHTDGTELLPWYRMMTLSDPKNVRAYAIGSWWLKRINIDESVKFIAEGIENNPNAYQLQLMQGQILYERGRQRELASGQRGDDAMQDYQKARESFRAAAGIVIRIRPEGGPEGKDLSWTDYMEEDARASLRMAVLTEREFGEPAKAQQMAQEYLQTVPDDGPLTRLAGLPPLEE